MIFLFLDQECLTCGNPSHRQPLLLSCANPPCPSIPATFQIVDDFPPVSAEGSALLPGGLHTISESTTVYGVWNTLSVAFRLSATLPPGAVVEISGSAFPTLKCIHASNNEEIMILHVADSARSETVLAGLGASPTPSGTLCLLPVGDGSQFQCPPSANCGSSGSGVWNSEAGTLLLTVRFGGLLDAANDTEISFRLLNPSFSNGKTANSVGLRAQYLTTSEWTKISKLSGSVLGGGESPQFLAALTRESR